MASPTKAAGTHSELSIAARFAGLGATVLFPMGDNEPYDLVIACGKNFYRIQVKTGKRREQDGRIVSTLSRTRYDVAVGQYRNFVYPPDSFDFYAIYCPDNLESYLIPAAELQDQGSVTICTDATPRQNGQILSEQVALDRVWTAFLLGEDVPIRTYISRVERPRRNKIGNSGYLGVTNAGKGEWICYLSTGERGSRQRVYVGKGPDARALAIQYDAKAIELLGPDAVTNRSLGLLEPQALA